MFLIVLFFILQYNTDSHITDTQKKEIYKSKVAVIDSGFDNVDDQIDVKDGISFVSKDNNDYSDESGHGTKVVNIIQDVNPNIDLYIIKSLDEINSGDSENIIKGIEWAINKDVDILNMSISSYQYSEKLNNTIENAIKSGIIIVSPSGNEGYSESGNISYPAKFESVISIGSVNSDLQRSDFSSVGNELDFMFQGESIKVKNIYGLEEIDSGTSFSAAYVSGIISKILNLNPNINSEEIYSILENSTIDKKNSYEYGEGIINENNVLESLEKFTSN